MVHIELLLPLRCVGLHSIDMSAVGVNVKVTKNIQLTVANTNSTQKRKKVTLAVVPNKQEAQLLLGDRATRKHTKDI